jgi:hypothetical protein
LDPAQDLVARLAHGDQVRRVWPSPLPAQRAWAFPLLQRRAWLCLLLAPLAAQQVAALPVADDLRAACEHARYGVRVSASKKVAQAGDAAVPAIRARMQERGKNSLPLLLVDAIAGESAGDGATRALLGEWADDREFFWRSQALKGLANRKDEGSRARFEAGLADASHLYRIQGARGLWHLGVKEPAAALLLDPDPRVPVAIAAFLLEQGDERGVPVLEAALAAHDEFLGDPWARRDAQVALAALRKAFPQKKLELPESRPAVVEQDVGGLEIRSCRNGDWFLRWDARGRFTVGLRGGEGFEIEPVPVKLGGKASATFGDVVCDSLQFVSKDPALRWRCAPGHVPAELAEFLKTLAAKLEERGAAGAAKALRERLPQFLAAATR